MFKYDYKYVILLDKLEMGNISFRFWIWIHYIQRGGVYQPFRWTFSRLIYHIYNFYIALLSYAIAYM